MKVTELTFWRAKNVLCSTETKEMQHSQLHVIIWKHFHIQLCAEVWAPAVYEYDCWLCYFAWAERRGHGAQNNNNKGHHHHTLKTTTLLFLFFLVVVTLSNCDMCRSFSTLIYQNVVTIHWQISQFPIYFWLVSWCCLKCTYRLSTVFTTDVVNNFFKNLSLTLPHSHWHFFPKKYVLLCQCVPRTFDISLSNKPQLRPNTT